MTLWVNKLICIYSDFFLFFYVKITHTMTTDSPTRCYSIWLFFIREGHTNQQVVLKPNVHPHLKTKLRRSDSSTHRRNWIFWPHVTSPLFICCCPDCSNTNHTHAASYKTTDTPAQDSHRQLDACSAVEMSVCHHYQSHNGESSIHYCGFMVLQLYVNATKTSESCFIPPCAVQSLAYIEPWHRLSQWADQAINHALSTLISTAQQRCDKPASPKPLLKDLVPKTSLNSLWNYC